MDFDHLQEQIKLRFWQCNELSEKQAEDCAWIAVNQFKKFLADQPALSCSAEIIPLPNKACRGKPMPGMTAVRQSEGV